MFCFTVRFHVCFLEVQRRINYGVKQRHGTETLKSFFSHAKNTEGTWRGILICFIFSRLLKFSSIHNEILSWTEETKNLFHVIAIIYLYETRCRNHKLKSGWSRILQCTKSRIYCKMKQKSIYS